MYFIVKHYLKYVSKRRRGEPPWVFLYVRKNLSLQSSTAPQRDPARGPTTCGARSTYAQQQKITHKNGSTLYITNSEPEPQPGLIRCTKKKQKSNFCAKLKGARERILKETTLKQKKDVWSHRVCLSLLYCSLCSIATLFYDHENTSGL